MTRTKDSQNKSNLNGSKVRGTRIFLKKRILSRKRKSRTSQTFFLHPPPPSFHLSLSLVRRRRCFQLGGSSIPPPCRAVGRRRTRIGGAESSLLLLLLLLLLPTALTFSVSSPSSSSLSRASLDKVFFPSVTLCNINQGRRSFFLQNGLNQVREKKGT